MKNQAGIILGFSELLLDGFPDADPRRGDLQEIHTAARRLITLLDQPESVSHD
jgi:hypothetical protein